MRAVTVSSCPSMEWVSAAAFNTLLAEPYFSIARNSALVQEPASWNLSGIHDELLDHSFARLDSVLDMH